MQKGLRIEMSMNYVICAAGDGTRFSQLFPEIPKALIKLKNRTLLEWSLASLPIFEKDHIIILTQQKHCVRDRIAGLVERLYPFNDIRWRELQGLTKGQLETAVLSEDLLDFSRPTIVYNSDTYFRSRGLLQRLQDPTVMGVVPCSIEPGDSWSFCKVDENDDIVDIREKERISDLASVGLYAFRNTSLFLERAKKKLALGNGLEKYIAPLYQEYLLKGERIVVDRVDSFRPMGSPDQIERYWGVQPRELVRLYEKKTGG